MELCNEWTAGPNGSGRYCTLLKGHSLGHAPPSFSAHTVADLKAELAKAKDEAEKRFVLAAKQAHDTAQAPPPDHYASLRRVVALAVAQAESGKGKLRHALEGEAFEDQKICTMQRWLGGTQGAVFQACKKAIESTRMPRGKALGELLGAINYLAAAYLVREQEATEPEQKPVELSAVIHRFVRDRYPEASDEAVRQTARLEALRAAEAFTK